MAKDPIIKNRTILDYPFGTGVDPITVPWTYGSVGGGYIYETAGLLVLGCSAGTNNDWRGGIMAYAEYGTPLDEDYEIIAETELSSASLSGENQAWFGLWQDDSNNVWWYCDDSGGVQRCYRITGGTWSDVATGPTMALPAKLRIVWEPHRNRFTWYAYVAGVWTSYATLQLAGFNPKRAFTLDAIVKHRGARKLDVGSVEVGKEMDATNRIDCPNCRGPMLRLVNSRHPEVRYEQCSACGGSFLDAGELRTLQERTLGESLDDLLSW